MYAALYTKHLCLERGYPLLWTQTCKFHRVIMLLKVLNLIPWAKNLSRNIYNIAYVDSIHICKTYYNHVVFIVLQVILNVVPINYVWHSRWFSWCQWHLFLLQTSSLARILSRILKLHRCFHLCYPLSAT